ncbi:MAG: DNA sulfur modification protein DndD [Cytophagia bacterium]|nr:MAG: DNA sulfur modification protein DndD [Cytophagia bacterium]
MIIKKVELDNFRIYKDHNEIDLSLTEGKNIFIVSGKNGFGKTTFLMSLVWCLYGKQMQEVDDLYKKEIGDQGGYSKYIANSLNRKAGAEGKKSFSAKITISDAIIPELTCREISIKRTYHLSEGESIEVLIDGFENETVKDLAKDKLSGEEIFIRDYILPIEIAKFFFFDAEKIVTLAEVNTVEQRKNLSKAYSEILGIKKYEDLKDEYEDIQKRLRQLSASREEQAKLNSYEAEVRNSELAISENDQKIFNINERKDSLRYESNQLQERLIRVGNMISVEDLALLKEQDNVLSNQLKDITNELQESLEVIPFAIAGDKLSSVIEQVTDEVAYKTNSYKLSNIQDKADEIITDLITEQRKFDEVITRKVQDFYFDTISKLVKKHFYADVPDLSIDFKPIHDFSDSEYNELNAFIMNLKSSFKGKFTSLNYRNNQVKNELAQVRRRIADAEAVAEDAVVKADRERREMIEKEIIKIEKEASDLYVEIGKHRQDIEVKKRLIKEITNKLEASKTNKKKDDFLTDKIQKLKKYIVQFKERKKNSLEKEILNGLKTLMHKRGFIEDVKVSIAGEDIEINLFNGRGEMIRKDGLSKGEQQMYATALLHGLVAESEIEFPVFIDSPMQKFDEEHALNIVKYFYPTISDQVILFPLVNKEMSQREFKMLEPRMAKAFLITNVEADKSTFLETTPQEFFNTYNGLYHAD